MTVLLDETYHHGVRIPTEPLSAWYVSSRDPVNPSAVTVASSSGVKAQAASSRLTSWFAHAPTDRKSRDMAGQTCGKRDDA